MIDTFSLRRSTPVLSDFFDIRFSTHFSEKYDLFIADSASWVSIPERLISFTLLSDKPDILESYFPLEFGEYITEPFFPEELRYRLSTIIQNSRNADVPDRYLYTGNEWNLLMFFLSNIGKILSYNVCCQFIQGPRRSLEMLVYRIRKKLKESPRENTIEIVNIKNKGYQLQLNKDV